MCVEHWSREGRDHICEERGALQPEVSRGIAKVQVQTPLPHRPTPSPQQCNTTTIKTCIVMSINFIDDI